MRLLRSCLLVGFLAGFVRLDWMSGAESLPAGTASDGWLDLVPGSQALPLQAGPVTGGFVGLGAEALGDELQIRWLPAGRSDATKVTLWFSWGTPGHWPARDWRRVPMRPRGLAWGVTMPVEDPYRPLVYAVSTVGPGGTNASALRLVHPRSVGVRLPTSVFWPFLEGFEQDFDGWRWLGPGEGSEALGVTNVAQTGRFALRVRIPTGGRTARVATTRVRDWHFVDQEAVGITFRARAASGQGTVRMALHGDWGQPAHVESLSTNRVVLRDAWQRVDFLVNQFPGAPVKHLDLVSFVFSGDAGQEFLLDDLQLLGPWPVD